MKNNLLSIDEYRNNPEFYFCKGLRCANKKNLNDAYKNLQKALELDPDNAEYKFNIACFLSEMKSPKEANRIFNDILLNFDPTVYDCYFGLGCNSFEIGDSEKAAEYFEKYLYFDSEGEFCEEVAEMIFYLKVYDGIAHNNRFIRRSENSFRQAKKFLNENKVKNATRELYKSIIANPSNNKSRNLLTLTLMQQQKYTRAEYINRTVKDTDEDNVWANCLSLYINSYLGKHSKVNKLLETLVLAEIVDREDLLCVATTLLVFNKTDELIILLEMYIPEYSDSTIYSILLLGYAIAQNGNKVDEVLKILLSLEKTNTELVEWITSIKNYFYNPNEKFIALDEYNKILSLSKENNSPMYNPLKYTELFFKGKTAKPKLNKKYQPIIKCIIEHREIMYTRYYEKEIIGVLNECIKEAKEPQAEIDNIEAFSAALEYIYCKQYFIEMGKEELIKKYNLSLIAFNRAFTKLDIELKN